MKGTLKKLSGDKWYVMRMEEGDWETYYPLHRQSAEEVTHYLDNYHDDVQLFPLYYDGKQVEFEIVISALDFISYAELVPMKEQTNGERFDEFMKGIEEYPPIEGTLALCEDIIKTKVMKPKDKARQLYRDAYMRWCYELSHEKNISMAKNICNYVCDEVLGYMGADRGTEFWNEVRDLLRSCNHDDLMVTKE